MTSRDAAMCATGVETCPCAAATLLHAAEQDDAIDALRTFAQKMLEGWQKDFGDVDGCKIQDAAVECGLLIEETRREPCGTDCYCASYHGDMSDGVVCYRRTPLLIGTTTDTTSGAWLHPVAPPHALQQGEIERLLAIEAAARNLVQVKGRYHSEIAMQRLMDACNVKRPEPT